MYSLCHCRFFLRNNQTKFILSGTFLRFSTSLIENQAPRNTLMYDYLINPCGVSREDAIVAAHDFPRFISRENPDSVLKFLKHHGFDETHIKNLISYRPSFLFCDINKTLKPKFQFFEELGLSGPTLADFLTKNKKIFNKSIESQLKPSVGYLRTLLRTNENVIHVLQRSNWAISLNLQKTMKPNVEILEKYGVSDRQIADILLKEPSSFVKKPDWLEKVIARVEKLGVESGSKEFVEAISVVSSMSKITLDAKLDLLKSFGWSDEDICIAFRQTPEFLIFSEQKITALMEFFLRNLGYKPSEIALRPKLFTYSLEKRLMPRNELLKILKSRGLLERNHDLLSVANLSEKTLMKDYVFRYRDRAPDLHKVYVRFMG